MHIDKLLVIFFTLGLLGGCSGDDDGRVYADAAWQVRCPEGVGGCPQDGPPRQVTAFDAQGGHSITCDVEAATSPGSQVWYFDIELVGSYRMQVTNATVPEGGGPIQGAGCRVSVTEGVNVYSGRCGASTPTAEQPCQLTDVTFGESADGYPQASGNLLCRSLRDATDGSERDITSPGANGAMVPTPLRLLNCGGL